MKRVIFSGGVLGKKHDILNLYFLFSRSFLFFYPLSLIEGNGLYLFKKKYFSNSLIFSSKMLKYFRFKRFFNFCKNQMLLISYKNIQYFLQFIIDQQQNNKLISCCCYGHFLNADMGEVLYLFKKYNKKIFFFFFFYKLWKKKKNKFLWLRSVTSSQ